MFTTEATLMDAPAYAPAEADNLLRAIGKPVAEEPPSARLLQMISGFWVSRGIFAAARLGLADLVEDEPRTVAELAEATGTYAPALHRLLRALASVGIFAEDEIARFVQTPLSAMLRTGVPGSLRAFATAELGMDHFQAWEHLLYSVKTGKTAFDFRFGMHVWEYYTRNPENGRLFDQAMTDVTAVLDEALLAAYDFSAFDTVVDVGGGRGHLLATILKANPDVQGILFDLPSLAPGASRLMNAAGLSERCQVASGDFFEAVPSGGDAYLLKWILHDWEDRKAISILKNCRRAMPENGRLLLMEFVLQPGNSPDLSKWADLNMMVMTGGQERTETEFRRLLEAAGFHLAQVIPTEAGICLIEGVPA